MGGETKNMKWEKSIRYSTMAVCAGALLWLSERAEAVCVLATDIRSIDVLEMLERDLGKPAISTNQALMWRSLALAGVNAAIPGFGSLLRQRMAGGVS